MMLRRMGFVLPAALSGLCLAALLGCAGRSLHSVPAVTGFTPGSAPAGAAVVIQGSGFKDVGEVSFGGQPAASFSTDGDDRITAVVPAAAITGQVTVLNPAGLGISTLSFRVVPVIDSIEPTHGPAGTTVTLTGSGFYGTTGVAIGAETPADAGPSTFTYLDANHVTVRVGSTTPAGAGAVVLSASGLQATGPQFTVE